MFLDCYVLPIDYGVAYGSVTLKSLQNDNIPELDLLVRESIQNSSDASLKEPGKNYKVAFTTGKFIPNDFNSLITGLEDKLNQSFQQENADFLEIRDTKTSGLTGCIRKAEITDDDHGNFFKLIYDTGKKQTQADAGGNWGFGKSVYYRVGVGIVVFYSRVKINDNYESRLIVTVVEDESKKNEDGTDATLLRSLEPRSAGKAWWGIKDGEDLLPVTDPEFINAVLDAFNLKPFNDNETGTSIIIPYIDNERLLSDIIPQESEIKKDVKNAYTSMWGNSIEDYLNLAIQRWYAPKIHNRKLTEICDDKKWLNVSVNHSPIRKDNLLPFFDLVQELYNAALAKNYNVEYECNLPSEVKCYPVKIRGQLEGHSITGNIAVTRITKEDLFGDRMDLSPYDYVGKFEADGGINEPIVMYTREPGMVIDYPVNGPWVKGITPPESEYEFLFAFYMPDTKKKLKSDLREKEYAGMSLGEYLRSCEASDHMNWADPAKMSIVRRIQKNTVNRIEEHRTAVDSRTVEAAASRLSGKLGRLFMPRKGYGKKSSNPGGGGGEGPGIRLNNLDFQILSTEFDNKILEMTFLLKFKHSKRHAEIYLIVESEGGNITPSLWQKDIGTSFPAEITEVSPIAVMSPVLPDPINIHEVCNKHNPVCNGEYCSVEISHEETSKEYTSVNIDSNILNLQLIGNIKIQARDKKYRFSFRSK